MLPLGALRSQTSGLDRWIEQSKGVYQQSTTTIADDEAILSWASCGFGGRDLGNRRGICSESTRQQQQVVASYPTFALLCGANQPAGRLLVIVALGDE